MPSTDILLSIHGPVKPICEDECIWRGNPIHPLVVFGTREYVRQALIVGHANTESRRGGEEAVVEAAAESQPPAAPIKGHAGHEHHIQRSRIHYRETRRRLQHAEAMAHQAGEVIGVEHQLLSLDAGDSPMDVWQELKKEAQVGLIAEGEVGEDRGGLLQWLPGSKALAQGI
jgi:hypothetical protein